MFRLKGSMAMEPRRKLEQHCASFVVGSGFLRRLAFQIALCSGSNRPLPDNPTLCWVMALAECQPNWRGLQSGARSPRRLSSKSAGCRSLRRSMGGFNWKSAGECGASIGFPWPNAKRAAMHLTHMHQELLPRSHQRQCHAFVVPVVPVGPLVSTEMLSPTHLS